MAVHPNPHNEAWKVVTNTGELVSTHNNGRDALKIARLFSRLWPGGLKAVRA